MAESQVEVLLDDLVVELKVVSRNERIGLGFGTVRVPFALGEDRRKRRKPTRVGQTVPGRLSIQKDEGGQIQIFFTPEPLTKH